MATPEPLFSDQALARRLDERLSALETAISAAELAHTRLLERIDRLEARVADLEDGGGEPWAGPGFSWEGGD
jgi:hypothetical protein